MTARLLPVSVALLAVVILAVAAMGSHGASAAAAKSISSGGDFTCAVTSGGAAQCWGLGDLGQLGTGSPAPEICTNQGSSEYACSKSPVAVAGLASGVAAVAAGDSHACALLEGGTVKCWGANDIGQLGSGQLGPSTCSNFFGDHPCSLGPVDVVGLTDVEQLAAGGDHTCARLTGGAVECWGQSGWGALGGEGNDTCDGFDCALSPIDSGVAGAEDITAGTDHTCVITGGAAKCFGRDGRGQLGNGASGPDSCHVGLTQPCSFGAVQVQGLTSGVTDISAGTRHTCALAGGVAKCWGDNLDGQLGTDNGSKNCSLPVDTCFSETPVDVAGVTGDIIQAGEGYTCVGPNLACWGSNRLGEIDGASGPDTCDSGFKCSYEPRSVDGIAGNIVQLAPDGSHTCARLESGAVQCWGHGFYGQGGNGDNASKNSTPVTPTGFDGVTTSPTAGAHPMGDANCDNAVNNVDGKLALENIAGISTPACIDLANVKCNDGLDLVDVLFIFKYAASLSVDLPGSCRAIGT